MPTYTDDFNRADAASLGANYGTESGVAGSLAIASNRASIPDATGLQDYSNIRTAETIGGAQYSQAKIQNLSSGDYAQGYVSVRGSTSALQGYRFYLDTTGATQLYDLVDDAAVGSAGAHTLTPGDIFTLIARGSALNGFVNGTLECSATDATTATGQPGLGTFALSATVAAGDVQLDDHAGGDLPIQTPVAGTAGTAASGNFTPGDPGSWQDEDLALCLAHTSDQNAMSMDAAWTPVAQGNGGGTTSRLAAWTARPTSGSIPTRLITHSGGQSPVGFIVRIRSTVAGKRAVVKSVSSITGGTDASIEHAAVTPDDDLQLVLFCNGAADDNSRTTPAGMSLIQTSLNTAGTPDGSVSMMARDYMSGVSTGTVAITQAASDPWASFAIVIGLEDIPSGGDTYDETVALAAEAVVSPARTLSIAAAVALTTEAGLNEARQLDAAALVALAAEADWSPASIATLAAALGLDVDAAAAFTGGRAIDVAVDLTGVLAALTAARVVTLTGAVALETEADVQAIGSRGLDETLALGAVATVTVDRALALAAALSLAAEGTLTPSSTVIADRVATLAAAAGLSPARIATITTSTTLVVDAALAAIGGRVITGDVAFAALADLAAVTSRGVLEAIALDATAGVSTSSTRVRTAALALAAVATATQAPTATIAAVLALAVQSEVTAARRSVMESALVLGATAADAHLAAAIYGRQMTFATVAAVEALADIGLPPQVIEVVVATLLGSYATGAGLRADTITGVSLAGSRATNITLE